MGTVSDTEWRQAARPLLEETAAILNELYRAARTGDRSLPMAVAAALERLPKLERAIEAIPEPSSAEGREARKNLKRAVKCGLDAAKGGKGHTGMVPSGRPSFLQRMVWSVSEEAQTRSAAAATFIVGASAASLKETSPSEPEAMSFPDFFLYGMLRNMKWPRKAGFLKKEVVDPRIVDQLRLQLCELGASLGAGRPTLGARLLADILLNRDWAAQPLSDLLVDLEPSFSRAVADGPPARPWESIVGARLGKDPDWRRSETMPWEWLDRKELRAFRHMECVAGLVWGLLHPAETIEAINQRSSNLNEEMPVMRRAGMSLDEGYSAPNAEQAFQQCEEMVASYEEECRSLVSLPAALALSPEIRARLV